MCVLLLVMLLQKPDHGCLVCVLAQVQCVQFSNSIYTHRSACCRPPVGRQGSSSLVVQQQVQQRGPMSTLLAVLGVASMHGVSIVHLCCRLLQRLTAAVDATGLLAATAPTPGWLFCCWQLMLLCILAACVPHFRCCCACAQTHAMPLATLQGFFPLQCHR